MTAAALLLVAGLAVNHQPVDCFVKDRFAQIDVDVQPPLDVIEVRTFFRSARTEDFHYVPMALMHGRYVGKLPRPREKAQSVTYYIEILGADGTVRKTPEITADVVKSAEACPTGTRIADVGEEGDVDVRTPGTSRSKPKDFAGVRKVVRASDAAGERTDGERADVDTAPADAPTTVPPSPLPPATPLAAPVPFEDEAGEYPIGAGDIVKVVVLGHEDLTQTIVLQADGTFIYPLLGRIKGSDHTPKELERKLTTLLAQGYVRNPQVNVFVQEYRSKTVFVVGEVSKPGSYPLGGRMTVLELLSRAGPTSEAGGEVVIVRPKGPVSGPLVPVDLTGAQTTDVTGQAELIRINIRDIQLGQLDKNIVMRPNDTLFVTQTARIYVTGEVRNPGPIAYFSDATVRRAISTAGGFTADASTGRLRVVREVDGRMKELKIEIDDPVQPGDTIIVKAKLF